MIKAGIHPRTLYAMRDQGTIERLGRGMFAEKFEAMVRHGIMNSRMKDFWDIRLISRQFGFDGKTLAAAIAETFAKRHTDSILSIPSLAEQLRGK